MKTCLIISGGPVDRKFAAEFLKGRTYDCIIAVDAGLETALGLGLTPTAAVGDFDTVKHEVFAWFNGQKGIEWDIHKPEKDETDTELALLTAMNEGCGAIDVIGATGGRMDHTISNIHCLLPCLNRGVSAVLADEKNRIFLMDKGRTFKKSQCFGKYISFLPLTEQVKGITLRGFKYPLTSRDITIGPSLTTSNEIEAEEAVITFDEGILICIQSRD